MVPNALRDESACEQDHRNDSVRHLWLGLLRALIGARWAARAADCTTAGRRLQSRGRCRARKPRRKSSSIRSRRMRNAAASRSRRSAGSPRCGSRRCSTLMARGRPTANIERLLTEAERPEVLWQASATMGEVRFGERRFVDAAMAFDRAIEIIKNETRTPTAPSKFEIEGLVDRAAQARLLAANAASGSERGGFVQTARDQRDGTLGGIYSPLGARHRAARDPGADHVRIRQDQLHQRRHGGRARTAQRHQGAAAGPDRARRAHRRPRRGRDQHEAVARARRSGGSFLRENGVNARRWRRPARARTSRSS